MGYRWAERRSTYNPNLLRYDLIDTYRPVAAWGYVDRLKGDNGWAALTVRDGDMPVFPTLEEAKAAVLASLGIDEREVIDD